MDTLIKSGNRAYWTCVVDRYGGSNRRTTPTQAGFLHMTGQLSGRVPAAAAMAGAEAVAGSWERSYAGSERKSGGQPRFLRPSDVLLCLIHSIPQYCVACGKVLKIHTAAEPRV